MIDVRGEECRYKNYAVRYNAVHWIALHSASTIDVTVAEVPQLVTPVHAVQGFLIIFPMT